MQQLDTKLLNIDNNEIQMNALAHMIRTIVREEIQIALASQQPLPQIPQIPQIPAPTPQQYPWQQQVWCDTNWVGSGTEPQL